MASDYFADTAEQKLIVGMEDFEQPRSMELASEPPRVDTPSFSFSAWVRRAVSSRGGVVAGRQVSRPLARQAGRSA